jgi:glycosyltransferase involved in cell wall biosynthesis
MSEFLAIAIPTWGRPLEVSARVRELVPQLGKRTALWVFENGRTVEVSEVMKGLPEVRYRPSDANRGVYRNVLRCIEEVDAEWVWILGDDDAVHPDAVERALKLCSDTDAVAITFRSFSEPDSGQRMVAGLESLVEAIDLSQALFLSGTIWRRSFLLREMQSFMEGVYSMSAQLLVLCRAVTACGEKVLVVGDSLVTAKVWGHRWSRLDYMQRSPAMLDCLDSPDDRKAAASWLLHNWWWAAEDSLKEVEDASFFDAWRTGVMRGYGTLRVNEACKFGFTLWAWVGGMLRSFSGMPVGHQLLFAASLPGRMGMWAARGLLPALKPSAGGN